MYTVIYTNWKNEKTEVLVLGAKTERDAWIMAENDKQKYLSNGEQIELGQVTKVIKSKD